MRKVKIFIGSSITELKEDRIQIGNFFRQLNDLYLDNGLYFQLVMCEDLDDAINLDGKQSLYDKEIEDSELSVFVFYKKVGEYTEHEFNIAFSKFKEESKPKILTVFKLDPNSEDVSSSVSPFAKKLGEELRHYYKTYVNVDSLKLWLIMQIKNMGLDKDLVEFENGKVLVNGEAIATYSNAPAFTNHAELSEKKNRLNSISEECLRLKAEFVANGDDIDLYVKYSTLSKQKTELQQEITETEKKICDQLLSIFKKAEGELSTRQMLGYRYIDEGKYEEALAVLDSDEIFADVEKNEELYAYGEELLKNAKKGIETNVSEIRQRIEALTLRGMNQETVEEIYSLYEKIVALCEKYDLDKKIIIEFTNFLNDQKDYEKSYEVLKRAKERVDKGGTFQEKSDVYSVLGYVAMRLNHPSEAIENLTKALKIDEGLTMIDGSVQSKNGFGVSCYNMSLMVARDYNVAEAEKYAKKCVEIFEELIAVNDKKYAYKLALAYSQMAWSKTDAKDKFYWSEKSYEVLVESRKKRELTDKELAVLANSAVFCASYGAQVTGDFSPENKYRKIHEEANGIVDDLAQRNPSAYDSQKATTYKSMGRLITEYSPNESPEEYLKIAYQILQRLAKTNKTLYLSHYAFACMRLSQYYWKVGDNRAVALTVEAAEKFEEHGDLRGGKGGAVGFAYYSSAGLYEQVEMFEECARLYQKCIKTYEAIPNPTKDELTWLKYANENVDRLGLRKFFK